MISFPQMDEGMEKVDGRKRKESLLKGFVTFQVLGDNTILGHPTFKSHRNFPRSFPPKVGWTGPD